MGKRFQVHVSDGKHYEIEAQGFSDAACGLICNPTKYPLPPEAVVGIEGPTGAPRFYKRRGHGRNLWPVSPRIAALELAMIAD